jgi:hypothetical protein
MLIALTAGMLTVAGTSHRYIGGPVDRVAQVALDKRTFSCDASVPGSQVLQGTVGGGPGRTRSAHAPVVVQVDRELAGGAYAAERSNAPTWIAWSPCQEAHAHWWFVGAGGAAVTHDTVLTITNPRVGAAVFDIDVYGPNGPVDAPGLHGRTLAGGASQTVDLGTSAPTLGELAVEVTTSRGLVAVSAADLLAPGVVGKRVRDWLPATLDPSTSVTLAGFPSRPTGTLLLVNPGQVEAVAQVQVIGTGGTFTPAAMLPVTVPPQSVESVPLAGIFNGTPLALKVTSTNPVAVSVRTTLKGDIGYAAGATALRGATAIAVPVGTSRQLVLSATGAAGHVTLTGYDAKGRRVQDTTVAVPAHGSVAVSLGTSMTYLRLVTLDSGIVGGITATGPKGIGLMTEGIAPAIRSIQLPAIIPGW